MSTTVSWPPVSAAPALMTARAPNHQRAFVETVCVSVMPYSEPPRRPPVSPRKLVFHGRPARAYDRRHERVRHRTRARPAHGGGGAGERRRDPVARGRG